MIIVHAYLHAAPEHREDYREGLRALRETTLASDAGCLEYAFWEDLDEPGRFVCVERWADLASLRAHLAAPHHAEGSAALDRWRGAPADVQVFTAEPFDL